MLQSPNEINGLEIGLKKLFLVDKGDLKQA